MGVLPRYPVYVPSRGRHDVCLTARFLIRDGCPFRVVVIPSEAERYAETVGEERLLVLPRDDFVLIDSRNWIKAHSVAEGHARHWQIDDNIESVWRAHRRHRLRCEAGPALAAAEDFSDRYENVAITGLNYVMFAPVETMRMPPFVKNVHVYSCTLINNAISHRWRLVYNDDTDLCLQVLADGWCTVLLNAFLVQKLRTMIVKGGNTDALYQGDGRLKMARTLERKWPGVVRVERRYGRPQHVVDWRKFDTPLRLRAGVDLSKIPANDYGLKLRPVGPVRSERLRRLLAEDA